MAVLGQTAAEGVLARNLLVSILEQSFTFLGKVTLTEEATAAARHNRPGDSVAYPCTPACVILNRVAGPEGLDPAEDFMPQDGWRRSRAMSLISVKIASAKRAATHPDECLSFTKLWEGQRLDR